MKVQRMPGIHYALVNKEGNVVFCGSSTDECVADFTKRFADLPALEPGTAATIKTALKERGWRINFARADVHLLGQVKAF